MTPATRQRPGAVADTFRGVPAMAKRTVQGRFWTKVEKNGPGECWLWTAATTNGYGVFRAVPGKPMVGAHRWSYEQLVGPIPDGLQLDHLCRVRHCVNPSHLEPVTTKENTLRGASFSAVNARKTHCRHGHEFTPENTRIAKDGRYCKTCALASWHAWKARKKAAG